MTKRTQVDRDYLSESGRIVFTREYLCARGTCCQSGCRYCPYGYGKQTDLQDSRPLSKVGWISLVPSWTETLFTVGAHLLGRTQFCIHPHDAMVPVPVVGGTKAINSESFRAVLQNARRLGYQSVLVVLDREENPRSFVDQITALAKNEIELEVQVLDTQVLSLSSLKSSFELLARAAQAFSDQNVCNGLTQMAARLSYCLNQLSTQAKGEGLLSQRLNVESKEQDSGDEVLDQSLSGVARNPNRCGEALGPRLRAEDRLPVGIYLVWRKPWIAVHRNSFIGDMVFAIKNVLIEPSGPIQDARARYPRLKDEQLSAFGSGAYVFLSTEPYDFASQKEEVTLELQRLGFGSIQIVDGETYSWFGVRALRALEDTL